MVTWRSGGANTTGALGSAWDLVYRAGMGNDPLTVEETARLAALGIVDGAGRLQVPVVRSGDSLHAGLQNAARRYVDYLEERMPVQLVMNLSGVDRQYAFAMAYHDVSWGIIERLSRAGQIQTPPALSRSRSGTQPVLRGAYALTPAYEPFVDLIRTAIEAR
jgi:hypothetical protein